MNSLLQKHILFILVYVLSADFCHTAVTVTLQGCGSRKTCFRNPAGCSISSPGCRFVSWKKTADSESFYEFEMSGSNGDGKEYIAFALGLENAMKDADMYYCDGKNITSGAITDLREDPTYLTMAGGLAVKSATTTGGVAQCVLIRPQSVMKPISSGINDFNIATNEYYLLVAAGLTEENGIHMHTWKMVGDKYDFSSARTIKLHWLLGLTVLVSTTTGISMRWWN